MAAIIGSVVRHLLTIYAGAAYGTGEADLGRLVNDLVDAIVSGDPSSIAGTAVVAVALVWSIIEKRKRNRDKNKDGGE